MRALRVARKSIQFKIGTLPPRFYRFHMMPRRILASIGLFSLVCLCLPAWGDGHKLEKQIHYAYVGKELKLRHFYHGDHLRFHSDGTLDGDATVGAWTVDGQISVEDVQLHGNTLVIKGRRIYVEFSRSGTRDALTTIHDYQEKDREDMERILRHAEVTIEIELPSGKPDLAKISSALRTIFLAPEESMMEGVPEYWRGYFAQREGRKYKPSELAAKAYYFQPNSGMTPPRVVFNPDPEYSEIARKLKYQGVVVVYLIVDPSGAPKDLQVVNRLGLGLDDQAVAAVSTWKFEPATKEGVPVPVAINVEVNFHLY